MFQSLFLWNSLSDVAGPGRTALRFSCFNPCFCGTRSRTIMIIRPMYRPMVVSILVFVELALGQCCLLAGRADQVGFNPCFCGTRSRTIHYGGKYMITRSVSILVFVELALGRLLVLRVLSSFVFQSLFLWNSLSDNARRVVCIGHHVFCFNPCFCGTRSRTSCRSNRVRS